ncbi:MAG: hypothetical protein SD837_05665 [Candidatus Electrothrix scaldis]|nr:MAG: hypothetical protein SD837_05665 [Candidatus Electrothrix sp. GW3-3]
MIDFSKIHGFQAGPRHSFEELVCQLARREEFPADAEFRRVEGAGGDGGVEAYWKKANDRKIAYQAKYFLRTGDIDWGQIDESVAQAIITHEELEEYVVAFPCDLTDRSGKKGKGKTGWEHWDTHVAKWQKQAAEPGNAILRFTVWSQSELLTRLIRPTAEGLRQYWFGEVEFSQRWFREHVQEGVASLDERFHPEDHVDVRIQKLFAVIARHPSCIAELESKFASIAENSLSIKQFSGLPRQPDPALLAKLSKAHQQLLTVQEEFALPSHQDWNIDQWICFADELLSLLNTLLDWCWEYARKLEQDSPENNEIYRQRSELSSLKESVEEFRSLCASEFMQAEQSRFAFIEGRAGTGKSHLFGKEASRVADEGGAVILALGQRMNNEEPWSQFAKLFHLPNKNADTLLGALDAAGEGSGKRALLLIDAINEGPGSRYWCNHILSFVETVQKYKNIACVISCRSEYFPVAIPDSLAQKTQTFFIRGFETHEEQVNAAKVFLDRRGIARPSTPWLAPEFVNPLFLRSVCVCLERDGKSEFPTGLHGTRHILSYYLDSVGKNIKAAEGSLASLPAAVKTSVVQLASTMVSHRKDYLTMSAAEQVIGKYFSQTAPHSEASWLLVLLSNGLIRRDPNPQTSDDPLVDVEDVIRFSFQRFQDFLMGDALVADHEDADTLFSDPGPLQFMLEKKQVSWQWRGMFEALSSIIPEKFGCELVDVLPGEVRPWGIHQAFIESVKWRERSAFTDRSLELLNSHREPIDVLLEVAVSSDHPWNAELLHRNLAKRKLPERDAFWTLWLNKQSAEDHAENYSSVGQLLDWCLSGQVPHTKRENQFLAALTLCWFFTASNRIIRDKATKALTSLFIVRANIFSDLLERFRDVDDLYVLERLLAAAYGASCRDQNRERLKKYSSMVFKYIFAENTPPLGLLLRDYSLGIIELARYHDVLAPEVDFDRCKPPYQSKRVCFNITEEKIEALARKAGGREILNSATDWRGDFARYEIEPRMNRFLAVPLSKEIPLTSEQRLRVFEKEVVGNIKERIIAFDELHTTANPYAYGPFRYPYPWEQETEEEVEQSEIDQWQEDIKAAANTFLFLLSDAERKRFENEAAPDLYNRTEKTKEPKKVDIAAAMRWVANRAYRMGWTAKRFTHDRSQHKGSYLRNRPIVERIGKKYQWLALDELLCRLADNNWLADDYGDIPRSYSCPTDVSFHRDIDPTLIEEEELRGQLDETSQDWADQPIITLPEVAEDELAAWPFLDDPARLLKDMVERQDNTETDWLVLYEHQVVTQNYPKDQPQGRHGTRQEEFRFLISVIVRKNEISEVVNTLKAKEELDGFSWEPPRMTDEAFLYEAPWRTTWPESKWRFDNRDVPEGVGLALPVFHYHWESHMDASLPNGFNTHLPAPWLAKELKLTPKNDQTGCWTAPSGETVFMEITGAKDESLCLLRKDFASQLLGDDLCILWLLVAERNAWPGGSNDNAAWRRSEGLCWHNGKKLRTATWKQDRGNGTSAKYAGKE